jgi:hypothetical protein
MRKLLLLLLLAVVNLTCAGALMTAAPGSTLTLIANPDAVPSNGGVSVLTAFLIEPAGTTPPDGTVVQFFTDLGRVEPREGKTKDGAARVNFISDSRSGVANVIAVSGGAPAAAPSPAGSPAPGTPITAAASATVSITVGAAQALRLIVIADPSRITESRSTHIIATVIDSFGNPVQNIGVIFTVPGALEFMDSQGHPIFSDTNGRAEDVLRTRRTPPVNTTVTVNVQILGSATGSVTVPILLP